MRIGVFLIATGKYDVFLQPLVDSLDRYFFRHDKLTIYLFADKEHLPKKPDRIEIINIPIEHEPFPLCTLHRYNHFASIADDVNCEYLFYLDVDMLVVSNVGREILGDIVCVTHPGFYKGGWGSLNCSKDSLAYLPPELCHDYKAGGFQGGSKRSYLELCQLLSERIEMDENSGVMAQWHDETHFNWYLKTMVKNYKVLTPSYCYPESWKIPFQRKILALDKNHNAIRN